MIIESVDRWPSDIPKPEWLDQVELLAEQEALALRKLGLPVYINWHYDYPENWYYPERAWLDPFLTMYEGYYTGSSAPQLVYLQK